MLSTFIIFYVGVSWAASEVFNAKITFYPKSGKDVKVSHNLMQAENVFENSDFVRSHPSMFYFHGHNANLDRAHTKSIVKAYTNTSFNILLLDWRELANTAYPNAVSKLEELGKEIVKFIQKMTTKGYEINKWHLVGHSLGAHLAGIVGRHSKSQSLTLPRITALDPAGPGFYILAIGPRPISRSDATFVDVIHTDTIILGTVFNTGTVDFLPNGELRSQPGCSILSDIGGCSHSRSIELWVESVESRDKLVFTSKSASTDRIAQMGLNCSTNSLPGRYDLKTNKSPPYSRG